MVALTERVAEVLVATALTPVDEITRPWAKVTAERLVRELKLTAWPDVES